ncbi:MAG: phosphoenolpyruvate synthase/pyruvate phosphate dikinase, partial [Candidatus Paceibacteria bacterium]
VLKKSKNLSRSKLLASQREFEVLKSVPISNTIENILWKDILAQKPKGLDTDILKGTTLSPGYASGQSGVLEDLTGGKKIDILLTDALNPSLTIFFDQIKGIVCERGGQLSHAAIIAREYNIPILQIDGAVSDIPASSKILLDTSTNSAQILP